MSCVVCPAGKNSFYVETHAVDVHPRAGNEFPVRQGDAFEVDIPVEAVHLAQSDHRVEHALHGGVGRAFHGGGEEQPFDVVALVKRHGQFADLVGGGGCARHVRFRSVGAVQTVVGAAVAHKYFQKGNTAPVGGKGVADPRGARVARAALRVLSLIHI